MRCTMKTKKITTTKKIKKTKKSAKIAKNPTVSSATKKTTVFTKALKANTRFRACV